MSNFTKGEWKAGKGLVYGFGNEEHILVGVPDVDIHKIICPTGIAGNRDEVESIANAQLISAAPEMYEALKDLVEWLRESYGDPDNLPELIIAEKALSKAEGK